MVKREKRVRKAIVNSDKEWEGKGGTGECLMDDGEDDEGWEGKGKINREGEGLN